MKNEIFEASELLYDKFKVKPVNTKLFLHHDIKKFLKNTKNPNAQSIFMPSDMSAHVPENRIDLLFHEYHAHGLYCSKLSTFQIHYNTFIYSTTSKFFTCFLYLCPCFLNNNVDLWSQRILLQFILARILNFPYMRS